MKQHSVRLYNNVRLVNLDVYSLSADVTVFYLIFCLALLEWCLSDRAIMISPDSAGWPRMTARSLVKLILA